MLQTAQTDLRWNTESSPSAIHSALTILAGKTLPEPALHESMLVSAALLQDMLQRMAMRRTGLAAMFVNQLMFQSARIGNNHELAEFSLRKTMGNGFPQSLKVEVAQFATAAEQAFNAHYPEWREIAAVFNSSRQLHWMTYGQRILDSAVFLTEPALAPAAAEFVPLYCAGIGQPYVDVLSNLVLSEFQPDQDEYESAMQIVWLALTLNLELDSLHGGMRRDEAVELGRMALVPVLLASAHGDQRATFDEEELKRLLTSWNLPAGKQVVQTLIRWWDVYSTRRPQWQTAMMGLKHMLTTDTQ